MARFVPNPKGRCLPWRGLRYARNGEPWRSALAASQLSIVAVKNAKSRAQSWSCGNVAVEVESASCSKREAGMRDVKVWGDV